MKLCHLTAHEIHDLLVNREVSAVEVAESVFQQIDKVEDVIHSYITLMREDAMATAAAVDAKIGKELADFFPAEPFWNFLQHQGELCVFGSG